MKWKFEAEGPITTSPAIASDGTIFVGVYIDYSAEGFFYAINLDGTEKWHYKTGGGVSSCPAIGDDGIIYFGSSDKNFYAVDSKNGELIWKFHTSLSYPASYDVESMRREKSIEIIWEPIEAPKEEREIKKEEADIADYGTFSGTYIDTSKTDYLGHKKKGYKAG